MPAGVVPREPFNITLHDTNKQTEEIVAIQATTGGVIEIINRNGDTLQIPIGDGQIIPLQAKGLILKSTNTTAADIIGYK